MSKIGTSTVKAWPRQSSSRWPSSDLAAGSSVTQQSACGCMGCMNWLYCLGFQSYLATFLLTSYYISVTFRQVGKASRYADSAKGGHALCPFR